MINLKLSANTGFYDVISGSSANLYGHVFEYIHGDHDTGYTSTYLLDNYTPGENTPPHIFLTLGSIKLNTPFKVFINLDVNLGDVDSATCQFYVEKNDDTNPPIFFDSPFDIDESDDQLIIPLGGTSTGTYYLSIWGTFNNPNLSFTLYNICVVY